MVKFVVRKNLVEEAIGEKVRQKLKALNLTEEELYIVVNERFWFVCGEVYEYNKDGEADGSITDYLYKGDEATARKKFNDWVNENHEMVKEGKGSEMEYQRYELGYETKDDTEYVEYAWWDSEVNEYEFDASFE